MINTHIEKFSIPDSFVLLSETKDDSGKMVVEVEQIYSTKNPGELIKKLMEPGDRVVEKSHCDDSAYFAWESILWGDEKVTYILAKTLDRWDK